MDTNGITLEDVIAEKQRRQQLKSGGAPPVSAPQPNDLNGILAKLSPVLANTVGKAAQGYMAGMGVNPPNTTDDYSKIYATQAIKKEFDDPTIREKRQAEIDALHQEPPKGFVRVGTNILPDPDYVKPADQRKIDEAEEKKQYADESLRNSAQENLSTIEQVKKGSKFFGPMGDVPSVYAPSSLLGMGNYRDRKNWESNVNKLLSQKAIDVMMEMKKASKNGASGFGALSEKELAVLQSASTALNKGLDPQDALHYLDEMEKIHRKVLGITEGNENDFSNMSDEDLAKIADSA